MSDVTICSVVTRLHLRLMALNRALINRLNPDNAFLWRIVDNDAPHINKGARRAVAAAAEGVAADAAAIGAGAEAKARLKSGLETLYDPGTAADYFAPDMLLAGLTPEEALAHFTAAAPADGHERRRVYKALASYHHAAALNRALEGATTRYVLIVDPDFYVIRPNWIAEAIGMMQREGLALFGAPWHPRWFQKYRGFPCVHFMLIDRDAVPFRPDQFAPDLAAHERFVSPLWRDRRAGDGEPATTLLGAILRHPILAVREGRRQRETIGSRRDTGYRLREDFAAGSGNRFAMLTPVFDPRRDGFVPPVVKKVQSSRLREAFLPARLRYVPAAGSFTRRGFAASGYPDLRRRGWEEFVFRGAPYAFHVRGEHQRKTGASPEFAAVLSAVNASLETRHFVALDDPTPLALRLP